MPRPERVSAVRPHHHALPVKDKLVLSTHQVGVRNDHPCSLLAARDLFSQPHFTWCGMATR
jgi:hypothetical protein